MVDTVNRHLMDGVCVHVGKVHWVNLRFSSKIRRDLKSVLWILVEKSISHNNKLIKLKYSEILPSLSLHIENSFVCKSAVIVNK